MTNENTKKQLQKSRYTQKTTTKYTRIQHNTKTTNDTQKNEILRSIPENFKKENKQRIRTNKQPKTAKNNNNKGTIKIHKQNIIIKQLKM